MPISYKFTFIFIIGDHTTGVWVGGSDNGHIGKWAWFPTGKEYLNFGYIEIRGLVFLIYTQLYHNLIFQDSSSASLIGAHRNHLEVINTVCISLVDI